MSSNPVKSARQQATRYQRLLTANPDYRKRETIRPAVWDETVLTERWEDRKARRAKEQGAGQ